MMSVGKEGGVDPETKAYLTEAEEARKRICEHLKIPPSTSWSGIVAELNVITQKVQELHEMQIKSLLASRDLDEW